MKTLITIALLLLTTNALAQTWVNGYYKKNGTYVHGHYKSSPNNVKWDNYNSKPNVNPYTGKKGYSDPYKVNTYEVKPYTVPEYKVETYQYKPYEY